LEAPEDKQSKGDRSPTSTKEFVMNEKPQSELELELQVVDLGDAKELTMGIPAMVYAEDNLTLPGRF
jgi:hypothetical protein